MLPSQKGAGFGIFGLSFSDSLAVIGLAVTVLLGGLAIFLSIVLDRRARRSSRQAEAALMEVRSAVASLPGQIAEVDNLVGGVQSQVHGLGDTILMFYRDILHLVSTSYQRFSDQEDDMPGNARATATRGARAATKVAGTDEHPASESGIESFRGGEDSGVTRERLLGRINELRSASVPSVSAKELVGDRRSSVSLFESVEELYRLRIAREIAWRDAVLGPDTLIELQP